MAEVPACMGGRPQKIHLRDGYVVTAGCTRPHPKWPGFLHVFGLYRPAAGGDYVLVATSQEERDGWDTAYAWVEAHGGSANGWSR